MISRSNFLLLTLSEKCFHTRRVGSVGSGPRPAFWSGMWFETIKELVQINNCEWRELTSWPALRHRGLRTSPAHVGFLCLHLIFNANLQVSPSDLNERSWVCSRIRSRPNSCFTASCRANELPCQQCFVYIPWFAWKRFGVKITEPNSRSRGAQPAECERMLFSRRRCSDSVQHPQLRGGNSRIIQNHTHLF